MQGAVAIDLSLAAHLLLGTVWERDLVSAVR